MQKKEGKNEKKKKSAAQTPDSYYIETRNVRKKRFRPKRVRVEKTLLERKKRRPEVEGWRGGSKVQMHGFGERIHARPVWSARGKKKSKASAKRKVHPRAQARIDSSKGVFLIRRTRCRAEEEENKKRKGNRRFIGKGADCARDELSREGIGKKCGGKGR